MSAGAPQREPVNLTSVPTLDYLRAHPSLIAKLPQPVLAAVYVDVARLEAALLAALLVANQGMAQSPTPEPDRLLTPDEAARLLGTTKTWLYRNAPKLAFTKRLTRKTLRFSENGLRKYLSGQ